MPRSPTTFTLPPGTTPQQPNTVISSAMFNAFADDVAQTFNTAQPIVYGGTGATTAVGGADALSPAFVNVASAATTNIGAAPSPNVNVTGTTTITAFDSFAAAAKRLVKFTGVLTLTHNATSLILPGGTNITTAPGDFALFVSQGSGNWECVFYTRASGNGSSAADALPSYIVNGSMTMSQENGNTLGTTNGYFAADQWGMYFVAATAAMSIQRVQVRTLANAVNQLEYKCTTAKASLGASDNVLISQPIEAEWFQQAGFGTANAEQLVMRFQVSLPAGLYHWHFANSAANRHCSVPFTIAGGEANTAVVKEIVIPPDTSGTWLVAEGVIGIVADLVLAAGATVTGGTASTWGATTYYAASTQFNILSSTSNVGRLADVGLKLDPDATGVYGQYEVGETDSKFRSERYIAKFVNFPIGVTVSSDRTYSMGALSLLVETAKTPVLLPGGSFTVNTGPSGTPALETLLASNSNKGVSINNSGGNWSTTALVSFTGILSARLS